MANTYSVACIILTVVFLFSAHPANAVYNAQVCCDLAKQQNAFRNLDSSDAVCGQTYVQFTNETIIAPAPNAYVSWQFCHNNCSGWGRSQGNNPSQWAAPLVQFLLPSAIFSMTIPQHREMNPMRSTLRRAVDRALFRIPFIGVAIGYVGSFSALFVDAFLILLDTVTWIIVIFITAGPLLVEGLLEAVIDYRILRYVEDLEAAGDVATRGPVMELLVCIVAGNLMLDNNDPHGKIMDTLSLDAASSNHGAPREDIGALHARLIAMMTTQMTYGAPVGAPVLFYLGSFFYNIAELLGNPSSEDAAISLAFGLEWMVIVHVAIVSGCLLASNNPSTSCAIAGIPPPEGNEEVLSKRVDSGNANSRKRHWHGAPELNTLRLTEEAEQKEAIYSYFQSESCEYEHLVWPEWLLCRWSRLAPRLHLWLGLGPVYETAFQPVAMRNRGRNKLKWLRKSQAWANDESLRRRIAISKWFWLFVPTALLILLPPIGGTLVAYLTPPVGFGCRSLTFITYATFQLLLTLRAIREIPMEEVQLWKGLQCILDAFFWLVEPAWRCMAWLIRPVFWIIYTFLLLGSLFTGVGGTLIQIIGVYRTCLCYINSQYWLNLGDSPGVNVASDTENGRQSAHNWLIAGYTAVGVMAFVCYAGWEYQKDIRIKFVKEVRRLESQPGPVIPYITVSMPSTTSLGLTQSISTRNGDVQELESSTQELIPRYRT